MTKHKGQSTKVIVRGIDPIGSQVCSSVTHPTALLKVAPEWRHSSWLSLSAGKTMAPPGLEILCMDLPDSGSQTTSHAGSGAHSAAQPGQGS